MNRFLRHLAALIGYGLIFSFLGALAAYIYLSTRFTSEPWHLKNLQEEFKAADVASVPDFESYLQLEDRLFAELHKKVYQAASGPGSAFNRYQTGSRSDPSSYQQNWNRSFEMQVEHPRGGILMMHGLTDSPYSVRALAETLHEKGFWVVGLRLPGHGTAPSALTTVKWQDWAAAARLAARYLQERIGPERPFYIMGYSTGASLAAEYSFAELGGEKIPKPAGLVLLSPAIGLSRIASLAEFQLRLAAFPGLEKLAWESVIMEYDPYKYNSFPVNAGKQIYLLTEHIQSQLKELGKNGPLTSFPRVLAFQSIVDASVSAEAVVDKFMNNLSPKIHNSLVLYDVNQMSMAQGLLDSTGKKLKSLLLTRHDLPFELTMVTNVSELSRSVHTLHKKALQATLDTQDLDLSWPQEIYSLSHVALPISPNDPIYGALPLRGSGLVSLGNFDIRGEKGVFAIPETNLMRLRYNPFFSFMEQKIESFLMPAD